MVRVSRRSLRVFRRLQATLEERFRARGGPLRTGGAGPSVLPSVRALYFGGWEGALAVAGCLSWEPFRNLDCGPIIPTSERWHALPSVCFLRSER